MYTEKDGKLLKWGGKRGGAAGRSSFWPREIDRSHHLNQDQLSPGNLSIFILIRPHICNVKWRSLCETFLAIVFGFFDAFQDVLSGLMEKSLLRRTQ